MSVYTGKLPVVPRNYREEPHLGLTGFFSHAGLKVYFFLSLFYLRILVLINGYHFFRLYCKIINKYQSFNTILDIKSTQRKGRHV